MLPNVVWITFSRRHAFELCPPCGRSEKGCLALSSACFWIILIFLGCVSRVDWGKGSHGTHSLPLFRMARMFHSVRHVLHSHQLLPTAPATAIVLPACLKSHPSVLSDSHCGFGSHLSDDEVGNGHVLYLIGCCVSSLQQCDLKTIAHCQRFILLFYLWISV